LGGAALATRYDELAREQRHLSTLYARLDQLRADAVEQLRGLRAQGGGGTHQWRYERDVFAARHEDRLAQLDAVEHNLCFGAVDRVDGTRDYVGRIGLADDSHNRLLIDWRAPAAAAFYQATPVEPLGLVRRRHLRTRDRSVVSIEDDLLDRAQLSDADRSTLSGEAALLATVSAPRTGRMGDIVATIQAEQDRVIRSDAAGVLVVDGGPGTGKTAVALHRAAYLLYTYRARLAHRGVLVVGPGDGFLSYIEDVLPALGESDVVLATPARLYPGVVATETEPAAVAALKGDLRMASVVAAAVRGRQRVPAADVPIRMDDADLTLSRRVCEQARTKARRSRRPHNSARSVFLRAVLTDLAQQLAGTEEPLGDAELRGLLEELRTHAAVFAAVAPLWARLTPEQLLADLYAAPDQIAAAGSTLTDGERALLHRQGAGWTTADVPLLDEAAELLGELPSRVSRGQAAEDQRREQEYARGVAELAGAGGYVDDETLAGRYAGQRARRSVVEHAAHDRTWAFGHVIVDEAQELSPMMWRALLRRCPGRSMTVVGDLAQAAARWGPSSWADVLDDQVAGRWRVARLTINYRTPAEIMTVAEDVLRAIDPTAEPPRSVRSSGRPPYSVRVAATDLLAAVSEQVAKCVAESAEGQLAVIAPAELVGDLARQLRDDVPDAFAGADPRGAVLTVLDVKGLEFDDVVLVEPMEIVGESERGLSDLYVALTRATQRLVVVHSAELPATLAQLRPNPGA
jgi:DNA helicase IV